MKDLKLIGFIKLVFIFLFALCIAGCSNNRISNDPVEDSYLGNTTTFEGSVFYSELTPEAAFPIVKGVLLDNRFKVTGSDTKVMRIVASREIQSGFVTVTSYFYPVSNGVRVRVVTQVPRQATAYYRLHEEIISQLDH
jgi:hypothetical protein